MRPLFTFTLRSRAARVSGQRPCTHAQTCTTTLSAGASRRSSRSATSSKSSPSSIPPVRSTCFRQLSPRPRWAVALGLQTLKSTLSSLITCSTLCGASLSPCRILAPSSPARAARKSPTLRATAGTQLSARSTTLSLTAASPALSLASSTSARYARCLFTTASLSVLITAMRTRPPGPASLPAAAGPSLKATRTRMNWCHSTPLVRLPAVAAP